MKCTHTWGGYACDGEDVGLLCYIPRGESIPRVDFSCNRFMGYHYNHGGIIVLVAWNIVNDNLLVNWLKKNRDAFQQAVSKEVRPIPEKDKIVDGAMKNYDALVKKAQYKV